MIYFDNAATSFPKPEEVYKAVNECMRDYCGNPGRGGHKLSLQSGRVILDTRELVAEVFNMKSLERVIFTLNATDSFNIALKGYLKQGDHVVITSMEHNSIARPLKALEAVGIESTIVECNLYGEVFVDDIEKAIKKNTTLIAVTHASNVVGTIMPISEIGKIAKKHNVKFMVDAAQTAGVYDIDVQSMNIDFLVFTGHKSLFAPQGVGGLCFGEEVDIFPFREGGTGSKSESLIQPDIYPDRLESGTPNTPGIAGLSAGIKYINRVGMENIRKHEEELFKYFMENLLNMDKVKVYGPCDEKKQTPVISINIGDIGSSEISYILDSNFNIATRSGLHCSPLAHKTLGTLEQGTVRFSIGYFNTREDVIKAVDALNTIVKEA
jgi:cysteine desulfurase family protein